MQQQPTPPTLTPGSVYPPNAITTEQIQKCLDDNKNLILAILENQNLGKLAECAQYQALLQKNLMYLAAIADAQPQLSNPSQMQVPPNVVAQQQMNYMQQPQAVAPQPQQSGPVPRLPFQINPLQPQEQQQQQMLQFQQQQQQLQMQAQMGLRPMQFGPSNPGGFMDPRVGKQDGQPEAAAGSDGLGKSAPGRSSGNRDA